MTSRPEPNAVMTIDGHEDIKISVHMPLFDRPAAGLEECNLSTLARRCGKTRLTMMATRRQIEILQALAKTKPETPSEPTRGPRGRWGGLK
ncbi:MULTISPECIES: hypothetical protein [Pseudomonas]|uniref:hypothetical protein n=1 Tax=Pseudomonas TaxID=286 RepID=UPI000761354D|nr:MULTISPECIES: hypothetical protein [Pseudomonas]MDG9809474.1 hypothetical protein [Pseudomonas juntendi]MDG9815831.1 hypothetical protein [Pseudomonas putida]